ncbi:MAG: glycosyltransferase family 2 protein [Rhizomicrobium sp.]
MAVALSVVVPVKDEAENVGPLAREIAAAVKGEDAEIIFVDDGSTDGTGAALAALKDEIPSLRVIQHGRNLGQSRGIRTGVRAARSDVIVTLDGDGQNDPADIPKLLAVLRGPDARNIGVVSGVRARRKDTFSRRFASRLGNAIRSRLLDDGAIDTGCGLKAFRREAFLALPYFDHIHRFIITLMIREGYDVRFAEVNHRPRTHGRSKYTNFGRLLVSVNDILGVPLAAAPFQGQRGVAGDLMSYLTHLYVLALQHPYDTVWTGFGFLGQAVFGVRMLIQWLRKRAGRPQRGADRLLVLQPRRRADQLRLCGAHPGVAAADRPGHAAADLCPQSLHDLPRQRRKAAAPRA